MAGPLTLDASFRAHTFAVRPGGRALVLLVSWSLLAGVASAMTGCLPRGEVAWRAQWLRAHDQPIFALAVSPDGELLATGSVDRTVALWDLASHERTGLLRMNDWVTALAFSPDGKSLAVASDDGSAGVWDVASREQQLALSGHEAPILAITFSPDGSRVATGARDGTARVWSALTGRELLRLRSGSERVHSVSFDAAGDRLVTGQGGPTESDIVAIVWDARTGQAIVALHGHLSLPQRLATRDPSTSATLLAAGVNSGFITDAQFSHDGSFIVTSGSDGTLRGWRPDSGESVFTIVHGHNAVITELAISPDDALLVSASIDATARVWDAHTYQPLATLLGHQVSVDAAAFTPDGRLLLTAGYDGMVGFWEVRREP